MLFLVTKRCPKTVDVMAYKPNFHTHKPGNESCATIVDPIIVLHSEYNYGLNSSFSHPTDPAGTRQTGKLRSTTGYFVCRSDSRLYQKPPEKACCGDIESYSTLLRGPCIHTLTLGVEHGSESKSNSPIVKNAESRLGVDLKIPRYHAPVLIQCQ